MNTTQSPENTLASDMKLVTFSMELDGQLVVVENVPARIDELTGEHFFDLATVDKIRLLVRQQVPVRFAQTPIFAFVA